MGDEAVRAVSYKMAMTDDELKQRVRELRGLGLSPKEIARSLGLRPSAIADLVRAVAAECKAADLEGDVLGCWVNAGWSAGLSIGGHPEWLDPDRDDSTSGLVTAVVARQPRHRDITVCVYLVDVYCLGVKNAIGPQDMDDRALRRFRERVFRGYRPAPAPAPIALVRELVLGGAEYAHGLGFAPHPDFEQARAHLGPWTGPGAIAFGCHGKPTYIEGPDDNPTRVLATLRRSVGPAGFDCTVGLDPGELRLAG